MGYFRFPPNTTAVQGIPIGRLNFLQSQINNIGSGAFPQMTTAQRLAISAINGQTAFDTDLNVPMIYVNGYWGTVLLN